MITIDDHRDPQMETTTDSVISKCRAELLVPRITKAAKRKRGRMAQSGARA